MLYNKGKTRLIACPPTYMGSLELPDSVTQIADSACTGCTGLSGQLVLPDDMEEINGDAFAGCTGFDERMTVPANVVDIGNGAFFGSSITCFYMKGSAPSATETNRAWNDPSFPIDAVIHYNPGKTGWSTPKWLGYATVPDFGPEGVSLSLDNTHIVMETGESWSLVPAIQPAGWVATTLDWSVEGPDGGTSDVITVDATGSIAACSVGTAYVVATAVIEGDVYTARCRIDVTETPVEQQLAIDGVQLGTAEATVELYKTDYTTFDLLLALPQNNVSAFSVETEVTTPPNNGLAIDSARFTDDAVAAKFDLAVVDDMCIAIVPKPEAIAAPKSVLATYKSTVTVTIGTAEFETQTSLTVKVKKTLPVVKAAAMTVNPFYTGQTLTPVFTGGKVTELAVNIAKATARTPAIPAWLTLDGDACTFALANDAPKKASGTVHLLAAVEGWVIPAAVSVSVRTSYVAPPLKLDRTSITLNPTAASTQGISWIYLQCKKNSDTLQGLHVKGIEAPDGYTVTLGREIEEYYNNVWFTLTPTEDPVPGKITLNVTFDNTEAVLPLTLTVKVTPVKLKLYAFNNIPINLAIPNDSLIVDVVPTPEDYRIDSLYIRLYDARGRDCTDDGVFSIYEEPAGTDNNYYYQLTVTPLNVAYNATYKLAVALTQEDKPVTMAFKTAPASVTSCTASVKVRYGPLDLTYLDRPVYADVSYKNYHGGNGESVTYTVTAKYGRTDFGDVTDAFTIDGDDGWDSIKIAAPDQVDPRYTYSLTAHVTLPDGTTVDSAPVRLTVKRTAVTVRLVKSSISLLNGVESAGITYSYRPDTDLLYQFGDPIVEVFDATGRYFADDQLNVSASNGYMRVNTNANTVAGKTYKVRIRAGEAYAPATLSVRIKPANTVVSASIRARGTLDVIRPDSTVTLTPSYRNVAAENVYGNIEIWSNGEECTDLFRVLRNMNGSFSVSVKESGTVVPTQKYTAKMSYYLRGENRYSNTVALPVTMGSAPSKTDVKQVRLFGKDRYSTGTFTVAPVDRKLGPVAGISIKDARQAELFEVRSLGENRFAIGFKDGIVTTRTSATVRFDVYYAGNLTPKPNATISVKVNIVP